MIWLRETDLLRLPVIEAEIDPSIVPTAKIEVKSDRVSGFRYLAPVEWSVTPYLSIKSSEPKTPFK